MKLTFLCLLLVVVQLMAAEGFSQSTLITLNLVDVKVEDALMKIEQQSNLYFIYNRDVVDVNRKVNVSCNNRKISEILDEIFKGTDVQYEIRDHHVILNNGAVTVTQKAISGKVTDASGEPLPGVSIVIKGTMQGTTTDINGNYSMASVPSDAVLIFSFMGMSTQEVSVAGQSVINVAMYEESIGIEEVVAIGYGTARKKDLTGAINSFSSKDFEKEPAKTAANLLQGRVPGTVLTTNNTELGATPKIRIRGMNSINGSNDPLVVIDGGFSDAKTLASLNTNDISSLDILKDASSTAIYGSRGANGVIIVTTKRGAEGDLAVNFRTDLSMYVPRKWDVLDGAEFAENYNKYMNSDYFSSSDIAELRRTGGTDWQDEIYGTGLNQSYNLILKGGTQKVKFWLSGTYDHDKAYYINKGSQDAKISGKFDFKFTKKLSALLDVNLNYGSAYGSGYGNGTINGPTMLAIVFPSAFGIYDENGDYIENDPLTPNHRNPYMEMKESNIHRYNLSGSVRAMLKYNVMKGLDISSDVTLYNGMNETRSFTNTWLNKSYSYASRSMGNSTSLRLTNLINYRTTLAEDHNLGVVLGHEMTGYEGYSFNATGNDIPSEGYEYNNLGSAAGGKSIGSGYGNSGLMSFFGRATYNYLSKYNLTATYRADGTSVFAEGNKWDYFPSIGFSWNASEEEFIQSLGISNTLKLRYSWGISGSQAAGSYSTLTALENEQFAWHAAMDRVTAVKPPSSLPNRDLRWEKTEQHNVGLDVGLFSGKVNVSLDYYHKYTSDLLFDKLLPLYTGSVESRVNLGSMKNVGFDANVHFDLINNNDWSWDANVNFSTNKNEVVDIGGQSVPTGDGLGHVGISEHPFILEEGKPLGQFYGYTFLGLWQESEAEQAAVFGSKPGDAKYKDLDNSGSIDSNDREVIGNSYPKFFWGLNSNVGWKNFTLSFQLEGVHGVDALAASWAEINIVAYSSTSITGRDGLNYWTPTNTNTIWAPPSSVTNIEKVNSTKYVMGAGFVKLRNISIAYDLPKKILGGKSLQLFVSAQNLLTITNYKGLDPEGSRTGTDDTQMNVDFGTFPSPRVYAFGLNLNL